MSGAVQPVSAETLELVLAKGDLSQLTAAQRLEYYTRVCKTLGLNPLTRPFRYMNFQGQTLLYATKDCTDQLRSLRKVNVRIVDKTLDGDLFMVTAQAKLPDGRSDEDVGAVSLTRLYGDQRANAIMRAMTKAKRRVTLSLCGLGLLDESELESMNGAQTFDAEEAPPPPVPMPRVEPAAERYAQQAPQRQPEPPKVAPAAPGAEQAPAPATTEPPPGQLALGDAPKRRTKQQWLDDLELKLQTCQTSDDRRLIHESREVKEAKDKFTGASLNELWRLLNEYPIAMEIAPEDRLEA